MVHTHQKSTSSLPVKQVQFRPLLGLDQVKDLFSDIYVQLLAHIIYPQFV